MNSKITALLVVLAVLAGETRSASVVPNVPAGFQVLGTRNEDKEGGKAITYYISEDKATHNQALENCETMFGGILLTPLNPVVLEDVREWLETHNINNEHIWTSGRQAAGSTEWHWSTSNNVIPISIYKFAEGHEGSTGSTGCCLGVIGDISNFGLCKQSSCNCNFASRYICQVGS